MACVPVAVLGLATGLATLVRQDTNTCAHWVTRRTTAPASPDDVDVVDLLGAHQRE